MTWFRTDDKFWSSPERLGASWAAVGVWVTAGSYCSDQLTDGIVSKNAQKLLRIRPKIAQELVEVGLWIAHENGDYEFKNWPKFNPVKADVEARREQLRDAGRAGGKRSGQSRRAVSKPVAEEADAKQDASISPSILPSKTEASPVELPTQPDPVSPKGETPPTPQSADGTIVPFPATYEGGGGSAANLPATVSRSRQAIDRMNRTAHSAAAHQFAEEFSRSLPEPIPSSALSGIAVEIDNCLKDEISPKAIAAGLRLWHESDSWHPSQIPNFVTKASATKRPGRTKPIAQALKAEELADQMIQGGYASA